MEWDRATSRMVLRRTLQPGAWGGGGGGGGGGVGGGDLSSVEWNCAWDSLRRAHTVVQELGAWACEVQLHLHLRSGL